MTPRQPLLPGGHDTPAYRKLVRRTDLTFTHWALPGSPATAALRLRDDVREAIDCELPIPRGTTTMPTIQDNDTFARDSRNLRRVGLIVLAVALLLACLALGCGGPARVATDEPPPPPPKAVAVTTYTAGYAVNLYEIHHHDKVYLVVRDGNGMAKLDEWPDAAPKEVLRGK